MTMNGKILYRVATLLVMLVLVMAIAMPSSSASSAVAVGNDDFNRCSLNTSVWDFQNPAGFPDTEITGQYQGDSTLNITAPAGQVATFSNTNQNAPRIMQSTSDTDFEVEVKFSSPLGQAPAGGWKIQGLLFRDTSSSPGNSKWLRVDLDSNNTSINYYIGYVDETGTLHQISGPNVISQTQINASPLYLRVKHEKDLNQWSVGYRLGDAGTLAYQTSFIETDVRTGLPSGFTFTVTDAGVFAGSTGTNPPGHQAKIDYFKNVADTIDDDANTLTVNTVGNGSVNWPNNAVCSGNLVTLTATPALGATFAGWSGDVINTQEQIQLTMNRSYNVTATFNDGTPIEQPFKIFAPVINR